MQKGGDYFFFVKGNQALLRDSIAVCFEDDHWLRATDVKAHTTLDKGHGRIERRTIQASREAVPYIAWPGLGQVCRIDRWRALSGQTSLQTVYAITSLPPRKAGPEKLLQSGRSCYPIAEI